MVDVPRLGRRGGGESGCRDIRKVGSMCVYTHQVLKDTLVEGPLEPPALPQLLVVVVKAFPVFPEFGEAVLVNVAQAVFVVGRALVNWRAGSTCPAVLHGPLAVASGSSGPGFFSGRRDDGLDVHTGGASGDLAALLQAVDLSPAIGIGLAHHKVVIVGLAAGADEERGGEQGR